MSLELFSSDFSEMNKKLHELGHPDAEVSMQPGPDADLKWVKVEIKVTCAKQLPLYSEKKNKKELREARDSLTDDILLAENIPLNSPGAFSWDKLHSRCGQLQLAKPTNQEQSTGAMYRFSIFAACIVHQNTIEFHGESISQENVIHSTLPKLTTEIEEFLRQLPEVQSNPDMVSSKAADDQLPGPLKSVTRDYVSELVDQLERQNQPRPQQKITSVGNQYQCELTLNGTFTTPPTVDYPRKKDAEKNVTLDALRHLYPECSEVDVASAKNKLKELSEQNGFPVPQYPESIAENTNPKKFRGVVICVFKIKGDVKLTEEEAKQDAHRSALEMLQLNV